MGVKVYQELIAQYIDYRGLESELLEWREKYADLAKKSTNPQDQINSLITEL